MRLETTWHYPTSIHVGAGKIGLLPNLCQQFHFKTWLWVTDTDLFSQPFCQQVRTQCEQSGLAIVPFYDIGSNPDNDQIDAGLDVFRQFNCQGVIAMGGGSVIDAAKAIALLSGQTKSLWDFEDKGENWRQADSGGIAPTIAIPTTAGTGSEVGRASVITDKQEQIKRIIFHPAMLPQQVILDPELTTSLPPALTAATGMDAFSHCLEAYCAKGYHPMAEGIAMQAMAMIKDNLPTAYHHGEDLTARTHMLVASTMGATAFQKGLGAMHALAHPLGAVYGAHHGRLNAILMPYVLLANQPAIQKTIETLAAFLKIPHGFRGFIDWLLGLRKQLGIENKLADIGIPDDQVSRIASMAFEDAAAANNPVYFLPTDYEKILLAAIHGHMGSTCISD